MIICMWVFVVPLNLASDNRVLFEVQYGKNDLKIYFNIAVINIFYYNFFKYIM